MTRRASVRAGSTEGAASWIQCGAGVSPAFSARIETRATRPRHAAQQRRLCLRQLVSLALRTAAQGVGLLGVLAGEFPLLRVPRQLRVVPDRDVHQVARRDGARADLDVGNRTLAAAD